VGMLALASNASAWRGYEYYVNKKVLSFKQVGIYEFEGFVSGSENEPYQVIIHAENPEKSLCNCPHAEGNRTVCKHKVALFFAVFPDEAVAYIEEIDDYDREVEEIELERYETIVSYVNGLSKAELKAELIAAYVKAENLGRYSDNWYH